MGRRANVLLITLDTTRADRLGCYGYAAGSTPALDGLATRGVCLDAAFAQIPLTLPSHASLLTGRYPAELGVLDNGRDALAGDVETLAEVMRKAGYRTGAFVAATVLDAAFGLDAGFDVYDDDLPPEKPGFVDVGRERRADIVCNRALAWLDEASEAPFFCWVHFFDPHGPYDPPSPWDEAFPDPYDGELAFADSQVARLLEWVERQGPSQETLIVVAGDHGEGLGEHGESAHGIFLYDSTLHVPLIFSQPGRLPENRRVASDVGLVDVMPTVLDLLGRGAAGGMSGTSFAAALRGRTLPPRAVYARSDYASDHFGWGRLECLIDGRWKYIRAPKPELYDRLADLGELHNRIVSHPGIADELRTRMETLRDGMEPQQAGAARISEERLEALRSLGYLGGGTVKAGPALEDRKDPKDMIHVAEAHFQAVEFAAQGNVKEALRLLGDAVKESPESFALQYYLGLLHLEIGNPDAAVVELEAATVLDPESSEAQNALGNVFMALGKAPEAIERFRLAIELDPGKVNGRNNLGLALMDAGDVDAAIGVYEEALDLSPDDAMVHCNLGKALLANGEHDDAIMHLERAIAIDPDYAKAHNNLGAAYARRSQLDDAIRCYRRALEIDASYSEARNNLGVALMQQGMWDEAVGEYEQALRADPGNPAAHYNRGLAFRRLGRVEDAAADLDAAVRLAPDRSQIYEELVGVLRECGRHAAAAEHLGEAVRRFPGQPEFPRRLAWLLATCGDPNVRNGEEAVRLAERLQRDVRVGDPRDLDTLAAAYAEEGRFEDAVRAAARAVDLAISRGDEGLGEEIRGRLASYEAGKAYREP